MITRRDVLVALAAAALTAGGFALADKGPALSSTIFDWNAVPATPTEAGASRSFFTQRTATLDELEVHVTTLQPGKFPHAPHRHPNEELLIVKEGTIEALINGEWKPAGPGSVVFFASNQLHGVRNSGTVPATYHVVGWKTPATLALTTPDTAHP
jgi:quercetin dioxygenase-like cupin family protein